MINLKSENTIFIAKIRQYSTLFIFLSWMRYWECRDTALREIDILLPGIVRSVSKSNFLRAIPASLDLTNMADKIINMDEARNAHARGAI